MRSSLLIDSLVLWVAAWGFSWARPGFVPGFVTGLSPVPAPVIPAPYSLFSTATTFTLNLDSQD